MGVALSIDAIAFAANVSCCLVSSACHTAIRLDNISQRVLI
jgi:hypothetical protein